VEINLQTPFGIILDVKTIRALDPCPDDVLSGTAATLTQADLTILGNSTIHFPYTGTEPLLCHLVGLINTTYSIGAPTNVITIHGKPKATDGLYKYVTTDANGQVDFTINGSPNDKFVIDMAIQTQFCLPTGTYELTARPIIPKPPSKVTAVDFHVINTHGCP
jgi:hypothetical protein